MPTLHCTQTTKRIRSNNISTYGQRVAGGDSSTAIQLADELNRTAQAERTELLQQAGFRVGMTEVTAVEGVAMKVDLAIPWNKPPSPKKVDAILIAHFC